MTRPLELHPDRLLPADPGLAPSPARSTRAPRDLPIISPHGHTDPAWFASNAPFADAPSCCWRRTTTCTACSTARACRWPTSAFPTDGVRPQSIRRAAWRLFAEHYHLFRGTPSSLWLDTRSFIDVFDLRVQLECGHGGRVLRPHRRAAAADGVPPARAVRPVRHRGADDHRIAARPARAPRDDPGERLERPGPDGVPPGPGGRSRARGLPGALDEFADADGRGHAQLGRLPRGASPSPRVLQAHGRDVDRPRPSHRPHGGPHAARSRGPVPQGDGLAASAADAELSARRC